MSVRHLMDTKLPKNAMQKPFPLDFVFRDIEKFDVQNPVVGNLMKQIQSDKSTKTSSTADTNVSKYLGKLKDAKMKTRFQNLKKFNKRFDNNNVEHDDDNEKDDLLSLLAQGLSPPLPYAYFPDSPIISNVESKMESENNWWQQQQPARRVDPEAKTVAVAVQDIKYRQPPSAINKKISCFSENLNKLFPQTDEIFNEKPKEVD